MKQWVQPLALEICPEAVCVKGNLTPSFPSFSWVSPHFCMLDGPGGDSLHMFLCFYFIRKTNTEPECDLFLCEDALSHRSQERISKDKAPPLFTGVGSAVASMCEYL